MKTKANIGRASVPEKGVFGTRVVSMMNGNPNFGSLAGPVGDFDTATTEMMTAYQDAHTARQNADEKFALLTEKVVLWDEQVGLLAAGVEQASGGNPAIILTSGFEVRNPSAPIGPLEAPQNLEATTNGHQGQVKLRWGSVRGVDTYDVQVCADPPTEGGWTTRTSCTASRVTLEGLPSVTRQWFRVRAVGAAGPSGWSEPAVKTVP
jgi:hypothetical protein